MVGQTLDLLPSWVLALLICGGAVVVTTIFQIVLHRFWAFESRKPLNELAGFIIAVVGVVYAVLLASIAILAIERYDRAEVITETESGLVSDIYRDAIGLPDPMRSELRATLRDYAEHVVDAEWPMMETSTPLTLGWPDAGWGILETHLGRLATFQPANQAQMAFLQEMLSRTNDLIDARRSRLYLYENGIKPVIWLVVFLGAVSTIGLALVFGIPNTRGHLLVSDVLALSISLVLLLIIVMDGPFSGASRVTAEPFHVVLQRLQALSDGS